MERDTILFTGTSNTFGLGVEWEVDPILNSEEYLSKGVYLSIPREPHHWDYFRKYRWSKLLCDKLNLKEFNLVDKDNLGIIGHESCHTIWNLYDRHMALKSILDNTKYIILELGYWRWFDEAIHIKRADDINNLPSTPIEIQNYINSVNADPNIIDKAYEWILNYDEDYFWQKTIKKLLDFNKLYPEIQFILLPWFIPSGSPKFTGSMSGYEELFQTVRKKYYQNNLYEDDETFLNFKKMFFQMENYMDINTFLNENNLKVHNKAKAFNGNYIYNMLDEHASIEGHVKIADMLYDFIKAIETPNSAIPKYKGYNI